MNLRSKVIAKRQLNNDTIVLVLEKGNLSFIAGQYIVLSFQNEKEAREYSIYNSENDNTLEILVKTLTEGSFSVRLGDLIIGDTLNIEGPFGYFVMKKDEIQDSKHVFIASGTGISPFRSYIQTYPKLNYELLHGIRYNKDIIEPHSYKKDRLKICVSREDTDYFKGRVSDYLQNNNIDKSSIYHLCGNSEMINDVSDFLEIKGIKPINIRTEVFF